ncbi:MAG: FAD-binding oxidoreductase [Actinocatenispora sp.]
MQTTTLDQLREQVRGPVITRQDPEYDQARTVYNAMIGRYPEAVVRCRDAGDVMATVGYAREHGLDLAVRGGSHSVPGFGTTDGGIVADLSGMRGVRVDPGAGTARAEGGCTWGDFNHATYPFGLATTGGIVSTTGIGGLTLGGGIGYLDRQYGLSIDNLLSADVVTADGEQLVASEREHPELFWALRGGGGNFGAVTSFEYRLHPVRDVLAGIFFFPVDRARDVLEAYDEYMTDAPEELGGFPAFQIAPPLPFIPESEHGKTFVITVLCWTGAPELGEKAFAPIQDAAPVVAEMVAPMPYPALNATFDELLGPGLQHYWKTAFSTGMPEGIVRAHLEHGPQVPSLTSTVHIYPVNGACNRVGQDATAYAFRDAKYATVVAGMWPDPADNAPNTRWVRDYYRDLEPYSAPGGYVNFMAADDQDRVPDSYQGHYDKLAAVKKQYDPDNVFHLNQNIRPAD